LFSDWFAGENTCMSLWHPPVWGAVIKGTEMEDRHRVYPMPTMADGGRGNVFWGWGYVVNAATEHPDLAWKLVHAITKDFERNCTVAGNWVPLNNLLDSPCVQENPGREGLVASLDYNPTFMLSSVYYPEIARIIRTAYELAIFEDKDVQEAMDDACQEIDEVLARGE
jgi:ABC-type glycerol-3-phosphate transport system substrate-binding protein